MLMNYDDLINPSSHSSNGRNPFGMNKMKNVSLKEINIDSFNNQDFNSIYNSQNSLLNSNFKSKN